MKGRYKPAKLCKLQSFTGVCLINFVILVCLVTPSVYRSSGHVLTAGNPGLVMQITFSADFAVLLGHRI